MARRNDDGFREGFSLTRLIGAPFRKLAQLFERDPDADMERALRGKNPILSILAFPFYLLFAFFSFVIFSWSSSRSGKAFLFGLPALLAGVSLVVVVGLARYYHQNIVTNSYTSRAYNMIASENYGSALVYLNRLVREDPEADELKLAYAVSKIEMGEEESGIGIIQQLGPDDRPGFAGAHQWLAANQPGLEDADNDTKLAYAERHLGYALEQRDDDLRLMLGMANIRDEIGKRDSAKAILKSIVGFEFPPNADVSVRMQLMKLSAYPRFIEMLVEDGDFGQANVEVNDAVSQLSKITATYPNSLEAWLLRTKCYLASRQYEKAEETVLMAQRQSSDQAVRAQYRSVMCELLVEFSKELGDPTNVTVFRQQFAALSRALLANHRNSEAIDRMLELCVNEETATGQVEDWLRVESLDESPTEVRHAILGIRASLYGSSAEAKSHFAIARSINDLTIPIVNSVAFRMGDESHQRPEDSLKVIDSAIGVWPNFPNLNHTRGNALLNLGRLPEAKEELDYAVSKIEKSIPIRQSLVEVNKRLGNVEEEKKHADELEILRQELQQILSSRGQ